MVRAWPSQVPSNGRKRRRLEVHPREDAPKRCSLALIALSHSNIMLDCQNQLMAFLKSLFYAHESTCISWQERLYCGFCPGGYLEQVRASSQGPRLHLPPCSQEDRIKSTMAIINADFSRQPRPLCTTKTKSLLVFLSKLR